MEIKCKIDNLDLEACIIIYKNKEQDVEYYWKIQGMNIAPEYTLTLFSRNKVVHKTYIITPLIDTLLWVAPKEDFIYDFMEYSMTPTIPTPSNWINLKGQIRVTKKNIN